MNSELKAIVEVLEGVFYCEHGNLFVPGRDAPVADILEPFIGSEVMVAVHHHPSKPLADTDEWGAGSCMWRPTGACPYGHHEHPRKLYQAHLKGVLRLEDGNWFVGITKLDLAPLEGHLSRLVVTLCEPPEELTKSFDVGPEDALNPEDLMLRLEKLRSLISGASSILDQFKDEDGNA